MSEQDKKDWVPEDWTQPGGEMPATAAEPTADLQSIGTEAAWGNPEPTQALPNLPQAPGMAPPPEATEVLPTPIQSGLPGNVPSDAGIFRDETAAPTQVSAEAAMLAAERSARKEARLQALTNPASQQVAPVPVEPAKPTKLNTDKFFQSFGLLLLRLAVAAILGIRGVQQLANLTQAMNPLANTIIPTQWHGLAVLIIGIAQLLIAFSLILGLLTRVAGFGLAALAGCALAFVQWGSFSIFQEQLWPGFLGELELLLAAVGVMFLCVGGGGWSLDRGYRVHRAKAKLAIVD